MPTPTSLEPSLALVWNYDNIYLHITYHILYIHVDITSLYISKSDPHPFNHLWAPAPAEPLSRALEHPLWPWLTCRLRLACL